MQLQESQNATKPKHNPGGVGRWLASPLKRSTAKGVRKAVGENDKLKLESSSSSLNLSPTSKANGVPCWEHPKQNGTLNESIHSLNSLNSSDLPAASPRKKQSFPPPKPLSPTLKNTARPPKRVSPKAQRPKEDSIHPSFENMVIVFNRDASSRSLGEISFDESYEYDEEYQAHQKRLLRKERIEAQNFERNLVAETRKKEAAAAAAAASPPAVVTPPSKTKKVARIRGQFEDAVSRNNEFRANGNKVLRQNEAAAGSTEGSPTGGERRRPPSASGKKPKTIARETDTFEGSEVSLEGVSLSELYTNWKGQTDSVASIQDSPCTTTSRTTQPSPPTNSQAGSGGLSINSNNNMYFGLRAEEQDDTDYIFGVTREAIEREQEEFVLGLVLQRSLEDYSSNSSISGFSSHASSAHDSGIFSFDTGQHAVRNQTNPTQAQQHQQQQQQQQPRAFLSSAGCHLAMVASMAGSNNTRVPPNMAPPSSILNAMDDHSDDGEEDLPYTVPIQEQATFIWKRDTRTNRWYKKPVFVAPSEEDGLLESILQRSARDALSTSLHELRLNSSIHG